MLSPTQLTVAAPPASLAALDFAISPTPLGHLLLAATAQGLSFVHLGDTEAEGQQALQAAFPGGTLIPAAGEAQARVQQWADALRSYLQGDAPLPDLSLHVRATAFQQRVWQALRSIPHGETRTYTELAASVATPNAVRAVASACAANAVALLVPCHRVVGRGGALTGYRWGLHRKAALLALERSVVPPLFPKDLSYHSENSSRKEQRS